MDNRTIEEVRRNEDRLIKEKENLEAQLELYIRTLKREHEAIKMLSELEEENAKLLKQNEFLMKDSNVLQSLEMYLKNMWNETTKEFKEEKEKFAIIGDYLYIYVDGMYNRVANYSTDRDKEDKIYLVDLLNEQLKENQKLEHNLNELKKLLEEKKLRRIYDR